MRRLRAWTGFSYRELTTRARAAGDWLPYTTLSSALARETLPRERLLVAFVRACGGDQALINVWVGALHRLSMAPAAQSTEEEQWWAALAEDDDGLFEGRQWGRSDIEQLAARTGLYRSIDDRYGGSAVVDQAIIHHQRSSRLLLGGRSAPETRDRLLAVLAEDAGSTAFNCFDAGRTARALKLYERAFKLAEASGAVDVQVYILMNWAYVMALRPGAPPGDVRRARQMAEHATRLSITLGSSRLVSVCTLRTACMHALLDDRAGFRRSVSRAFSAFDGGPSDNDPSWLDFFQETNLHYTLARGWIVLGDHQNAVRQAERANLRTDTAYAVTHLRNHTLGWLVLALAHTEAGMHDQACEEALTGLEVGQAALTSAVVGHLLTRLTTAIKAGGSRTSHEFLTRTSELTATGDR